MNLEQITTSLELSIRLKELGVNKPSLFYYDYDKLVCTPDGYTPTLPNKYSAWTTDELLEILPEEIVEDGEYYYLSIDRIGGVYEVIYCTNEECPKLVGELYDDELISYDTLPEALAKLLIHLIENKLINI